MEIWETEVPIRQIRIDEEDMEESFGLVKDIHVPTVNIQTNASDQKDYEWKSSDNMEGKGMACDSKSWEISLVPECNVTTDFPLDSFTDSFVQFCSQTNSPVQQQQEQFEGMNSQEMHSDNEDVVLEVLRSAPQNIVSHTGQDLKENGYSSEISAKTVRKRKQSVAFEERFDETTCADIVTRTRSSSDRISLVVPSVNTRAAESVNIAQIREAFLKQKRQRSNSEVVDDDRVIASLMKELVVRVALELDFIKSEATSVSLCTGQTQRQLLKIISVEEAKRDFGDLTLEELLKGVSNLRSSAAAQNCLRKGPKMEVDVQERQAITDVRLQQSVDRHTPNFEKNDSEKLTKISTEMSTSVGMQPSLRKRRSDSAGRPALPRNLPADQKCIAAVELALKQSMKGIKGPEEMSPAPRTSIL